VVRGKGLREWSAAAARRGAAEDHPPLSRWIFSRAPRPAAGAQGHAAPGPASRAPCPPVPRTCCVTAAATAGSTPRQAHALRRGAPCCAASSSGRAGAPAAAGLNAAPRAATLLRGASIVQWACGVGLPAALRAVACERLKIVEQRGAERSSGRRVVTGLMRACNWEWAPDAGEASLKPAARPPRRRAPSPPLHHPRGHTHSICTARITAAAHPALPLHPSRHLLSPPPRGHPPAGRRSIRTPAIAAAMPTWLAGARGAPAAAVAATQRAFATRVPPPAAAAPRRRAHLTPRAVSGAAPCAG
jgi:hypothetical protein